MPSYYDNFFASVAPSVSSSDSSALRSKKLAYAAALAKAKAMRQNFQDAQDASGKLGSTVDRKSVFDAYDAGLYRDVNNAYGDYMAQQAIDQQNPTVLKYSFHEPESVYGLASPAQVQKQPTASDISNAQIAANNAAYQAKAKREAEDQATMKRVGRDRMGNYTTYSFGGDMYDAHDFNTQDELLRAIKSGGLKKLDGRAGKVMPRASGSPSAQRAAAVYF